MARNPLWAAWLCAVAVGGTTARAWGDEGLPSGGLGIAGGFRHGVGRLGELYDLGEVWGIQATYHPTSLEQTWSVGGIWSVLWGRLAPSDPTVTDGTLRLLEMSIALRIRRVMSSRDPVYLTLSPIGVVLLSTNLPTPPDGERRYLGPYAGIGAEMFLGDSYLLSVEARYGVFTGGPGSLTYLLCLSFGSGG